jgi:hypothetical protein
VSDSHDWETTLDHAIASFGGQPLGPHLEPIIRKHHAEHPHVVQAAINRIANGYAQGTIRSPWGALKADLERRHAAAPAIKQGNEEQQALARTSQWMRAAGMHYDRWPEIHDELFGDRGTIREHPALEQQLHDLWQELRPIGQQLDQELEERSAKYRADLTKQRAKPNIKNADKPPTCTGCGQTEGHSDTCPKLQRMRQLQTKAQAA